MGDVIPHDIVAAYRARRTMLATAPKTEPGDSFRHIADIVRECVIRVAETKIENWRRSSHG